MFKYTYEVRSMFLDFFKINNHILYKSSSLVPYNDNSLLFTNAGMNQFKNIFLGYDDIIYDNVVTVQRCLRVGGKHNDLSNVGRTFIHNTFFEMMGNFSFNSYFKEDAIIYSWKLLTDKSWYFLPKDRLFVTVHANDKDSYRIWSKIIKIPENHIFVVGKNCNKLFDLNSDNFWRMSNVGPCGYSTEIFYVSEYKTDNKNDFILKIKKNNYLEIWNLVFIEYNIDINKNVFFLNKKFVDTGMGLERITSVLQNVNSNFNIDIFLSIKKNISYLLNININSKNIIIFNIISDHIRAIVFLIFDGILPSNEFRGYVLRKLIRRTISYIRLLNVCNIFLFKIIDYLYPLLKKNYFFSKENISYIKSIVLVEEKKFLNILNNSIEILFFYLNKFCINLNKNILDGKFVFLLYDTYGLPIDLISDFYSFYNISLDIYGFNKLLDLQKKKSRFLSKFNNLNINFNNLNKTNFFGYTKNTCKSIVIGIFKDNCSLNKIIFSDKGNFYLLLNNTVFFPESGGQKGDIGLIYKIVDGSKFIVTDTKLYGNYILHFGYLERGFIKINDIVYTSYDINYRCKISCNHSSSHLLIFVLKKILKIDFLIKGSCIKENYFSVDFFYKELLNKKIIFNIILLMNKFILKKVSIYSEIIDKKNIDLKLDNSNFSFILNNSLRIIKFNNLFSEYCCGTHISNTLEIGFFNIIDFYSISSGVKRIVSCTNLNSLKFINDDLFIFKNICKLLCIDKKNIYKKIFSFINIQKKIKKKNNNIIKLYINSIVDSIDVKKIIIFNEIKFFIKKFINYDFIKNKIILFNLFKKIKDIYMLSLVLFLCYDKNIRYFIIFIDLYLYKKIIIDDVLDKLGNFNKLDSVFTVKSKFFNIYIFKEGSVDIKKYFNIKKLVKFIKFNFLKF